MAESIKQCEKRHYLGHKDVDKLRQPFCVLIMPQQSCSYSAPLRIPAGSARHPCCDLLLNDADSLNYEDRNGCLGQNLDWSPPQNGLEELNFQSKASFNRQALQLVMQFEGLLIIPESPKLISLCSAWSIHVPNVAQ